MRQKPNLKLRQVGDKYMIVDLSTQSVNLANVFSLNGTAAAIWEQFQNRDFTADDIVEWLCATYDVTASQAAADTADLVSCWLSGNLIES